MVEIEFLLELVFKFEPHNLHWLRVLKYGERFWVKDHVAEESIQKLYHPAVPSEITSIEGSVEDLLLWIIAVEFDTIQCQFLFARGNYRSKPYVKMTSVFGLFRDGLPVTSDLNTA